MITSRGSTTTSDGVQIIWDRRGNGPPLLVLHGMTDYRQLMEPLALRFGKSHDVLNVDLRGHGESGHNDDFSLARFSADILEVCLDLGLHAPVLVGHSLGALVATVAAPKVAASAVVNIDQSLNLNASARKLAPIVPQLRDPATFHATLDALFAGENTPGLDPALQAKLDRCAWMVDPDVVLGIWAYLIDGPSTKIDALVEEILSAVTMPYLAYLGSDPGPEYRLWLQNQLPSATIEAYVGEHHFLHLAHPDRLVDRVRAFIV